MDKIFSGVLCTALVAEVLVSLLPGGNLKKFARVAVGLLVSLMLLRSLVGCGDRLPLLPQPPAEEQSSVTAGRLIEDVYRQQLAHTNSQKGEEQK